MATDQPSTDSVQTELLKKVASENFASADLFNREAWSRNEGLISAEEQIKLSNFKIAIPGLGGVGGSHLITLLRSGFTKFHLADFDTFEIANFNRQYGAKVNNIGAKKLDVMIAEAFNVNPFAEIKSFPNGISERKFRRIP